MGVGRQECTGEYEQVILDVASLCNAVGVTCWVEAVIHKELRVEGLDGSKLFGQVYPLCCPLLLNDEHCVIGFPLMSSQCLFVGEL